MSARMACRSLRQEANVSGGSRSRTCLVKAVRRTLLCTFGRSRLANDGLQNFGPIAADVHSECEVGGMCGAKDGDEDEGQTDDDGPDL